MKKEEAKNHPHLLMLDEFNGKIEGELKYNKCLYKYRYNALEQQDWSFKREQWGPTDPGFTSIMQSMDDLDLANSDDEGHTHIFEITGKGEDVASGLKRGISKLDPDFSGKLGVLIGVAEEDKDRSGSEIVEDDPVQEAKEETYQSDV